MRLVKIQTPEGQGEAIVRIAFDVGVGQVTLRQEQIQRPGQPRQTRDVVDAELATHVAKDLIDAVMHAPFYDPAEYAITVRQPRSITSRQPVGEVTWPLAEPTPDLLEELWQFSHVTAGFCGRVLLAAMLLAYGMLQDQLLIMIAGLLFLQALPQLLAIAFGLKAREPRLAGQGALALAVGIGLAVLGGAIVGLLVGPPLRFTSFGTTLSSALIALVVGAAAGLALPDDAGRRELIGLATASQVALPSVWLGISLAFGGPASPDASVAGRALSLLLSLAVIVAAALVAYTLLGLRGSTARVASRSE